MVETNQMNSNLDLTSSPITIEEEIEVNCNSSLTECTIITRLKRLKDVSLTQENKRKLRNGLWNNDEDVSSIIIVPRCKDELKTRKHSLSRRSYREREKSSNPTWSTRSSSTIDIASGNLFDVIHRKRRERGRSRNRSIWITLTNE